MLVHGEAAKTNININAIDNNPVLIELAKSGYIIYGDNEREFANSIDTGNSNTDHPLKGSGVDDLLEELPGRPSELNSLFDRFKSLSTLENDPVVNVQINQGLKWCRVKRENTVPVEFKHQTIQNFLENFRPTKAKIQIFDMANALGYLLYPDSQNTGIQGLYTLGNLKVMCEALNTLKEKCRGKTTYVLLGGMESSLFNSDPSLFTFLKAVFGLQPLDPMDLEQQYGIPPQKVLLNHIYQLDTSKKANMADVITYYKQRKKPF